MIVMMMAMTPSLDASSRLVLMAPVWRQRLLEDHADASFREAAPMYGCEVRAPRQRASHHRAPLLPRNDRSGRSIAPVRSFRGNKRRPQARVTGRGRTW